MTTSYYAHEDDWYDGDWFYEDEFVEAAPARGAVPFDVIALSAVLLIVIVLVAGLSRINLGAASVAIVPVPRQEQTVEESPPKPAAPPVTIPDAELFVMPYTEYILTQGPHGMSYGHYAIDLAAGNGEPVLSPINGRVTELYVDGIGNPTLVIANEAYEVTMMHGQYNIVVGQEVQAGEQVGTESNQGNTRDMAGNSCRNRNCGYHTHLNVFSKTEGQNVNPLDLLPKPFAN